MPNLIGTAPYQVPTNADLGSMAHQENDAVSITGGSIALGGQAGQGYFQDTDITDIRPTLLLDFANSKSLDRRVDFKRSTSGNYYDGVTVVKGDENLYLQSSPTGSTSWDALSTRSKTILNSALAPDGTMTAHIFCEDTTASQSHNQQLTTPYIVAGTPVTISIFAKANTRSWICLSEYYAAKNTWFDLANGVVGKVHPDHIAKITAYAGGWYRCSISFYAGASSPYQGIFYICNANGVQDYTGLGNDYNIFIWGPQCETRIDGPSIYCPTTSIPYTTSQPVLKSAGPSEPRFDHDPVTNESKGLLIEEQKTNLLLYSQSYSSTGWSLNNVTVWNNAAVAPDGTMTAIYIAGNSGFVRHEIHKLTTETTSTEYTYSFYAKSVNKKYTKVAVSSSGANPSCHFDLVNGQIISSNSVRNQQMQNVGNGWWRCSFTYTSLGYNRMYMSFGSNSILGGGQVYASPSAADGDGYSGILIWGAQLETGTLTSYIKTEDTQVSRGSDIVLMEGDNFYSWFKHEEGTFYAHVNPPIYANGGSSKGVFSVTSNLSAYNTIDLYYYPQMSGSYASIRYNNADQVAYNKSGVVPTRAAVAYKRDNINYAYDGSLAGVSSGTASPFLSQMIIGNVYTTSHNFYLNSHIRKLAYYPKRLSDAELAEMTTA